MTRNPTHTATTFALTAALITAAHAKPGGATSTGQPATSTVTPAKARLRAKPKPLPPGAVTEDWPSFLGPRRDGISRETKLLASFPPAGPKLVWELNTGSGYAAPAVVGDRLIFFHRVGDEERIECRNAVTGKLHWTHGYPSHYKDRYEFGNGPRAAPVVDGDTVFTHGAEGMLHALGLMTGKVLWHRDTSKEFNVPQDFFGVGSTPLVEGNRLIVNVGAPGGPCVVAFDKQTGKTVWKAGDRWGPSYASPVAAVVHNRRRLFVFAGGESDPPTGGLLVIDPATGTIETRFPFRSKSYISVNAATPVVIDHHVFITSAYRTGGTLLNIKPDTTAAPLWKTKALRAHYATPIHKGGYLYGIDGSGEAAALVCADLQTGKRQWRKDLTFEQTVVRRGKKETVTMGLRPAALLLADGRFLCLGEHGHLLALDLTPGGYKEISRSRLFSARETFAGPVLSRGLLYVMQNTTDTKRNAPPRLLCYDLRSVP